MSKKKGKKRGPKEKPLKIKGWNWRDAIKKALGKKPPDDKDWPRADKAGR